MRKQSDLSLHFSTNDFRIDGVAYARLPIFVRTTSMRIELIPTEYGIYNGVVRGRARSPKTWKSVGYSLLAFLRFMEDEGFNWRRPTEERLAHYRTHLEERLLARATIARSMSAICTFYEWAQTRGHIEPFELSREFSRERNVGMLSHIERLRMLARPALIPRVPRRRRFPRYYDQEQQEQLMMALSERDRLMMEWALYTGAREFEICDLQLCDIPDPSSYRGRKVYAIRIIGKGNVEADLHVPTWLLDRTYQYIRYFARREVVRAAHKAGRSVNGHVFLGRWGHGLKPDSLYRAFRKALKAAKLTGRFHDLRHTYAISTLHKLMSLPRHANNDGMNAILELKYLLRHESLTSTQVYLEAWRYYHTDIYADLYQLPEAYQRGASI